MLPEAVSSNETEALKETEFNEYKSNNMERSFTGDTNIKIQAGLSVDTYAATENTDPNYAYLVTNDTVMQGAIETTSEFRWYGFILDKKSKVSVVLQTVANLDADLYMFSLNQETFNLELIGGSATEGQGVEEYYNEVLEPGTYFFAIAGYEGTGNFAFAYFESTKDVDNEINDNIMTATEAELSTNINGIIDNPKDKDYYKFTVTERTILRYNITSSNGYELGYAGVIGSAPIRIDGNLIKLLPGTYYFGVFSPNGSYSSESTYTINFKKIGEYADESIVPMRAIHEETGIIFQTNLLGTKYYVNGNPIDIDYEYHYKNSSAGGYENYNITLKENDYMWLQIWDEEVAGPDVVYYESSTKPYRDVGSKYLLRLMFVTYIEAPEKFYRINCRGTGAYADNTCIKDPLYAIVLIDPDTGKLVDITEENYFYDHAMGSNEIFYGGRRQMTFGYKQSDYID